mgnify:FL=1
MPQTAEELGDWCEFFLGLHFSNKALSPGATAPLQVLWRIFSQQSVRNLYIAARGSGKTVMLATLQLLFSHFYKTCKTVHISPTQKQSIIAYNDFQSLIHSDDEQVPWRDFSKFIKRETNSETDWSNGSRVEVRIGSNEQGVRGPHVQKLSLDEVDEIKSEIIEVAIGMRRSTDELMGQLICVSTWNTDAGPVSDFMATWETQNIMYSTFLEAMQKCEGDCEKCKKIKTKDNKLNFFDRCHGEIKDGIPYGRAHKNHPGGGSDGHVLVETFQENFRDTSAIKWLSEYESRSPETRDLVFYWFMKDDPHYHSNLKYDPNYPLLAGADYGSSRDPSVVIFGQHISDRDWHILGGIEVKGLDSAGVAKKATEYAMKNFGKVPDWCWYDPSASGLKVSLINEWPDCYITFAKGKYRNDKTFRMIEAVGIPGLAGQIYIQAGRELNELRREMGSYKFVGENKTRLIGRSPDWLDALSYMMAGKKRQDDLTYKE